MSVSKSKSFIRLGVIAGIILLALLIGWIMGPESFDLVASVLRAIGLVLLGITILVTIHELGHFLTAKMFGMRVETFSIGFPPKLFSLTKGETEYQIGATPLGGFVKISGIIDESLDTEHLNEAPKPWEFRSKPVWQRLIVMTGGVIMNILLGIFIFSMLFFWVGDFKTPVSELPHGIEVPQYVQDKNRCGEFVDKTTLGHYIGLRSGDQFVSFLGESLPYLEDYMNPNRLLEDAPYYEVIRDGQKIRIDVPEGILNQFSNDTIAAMLFSPGLNLTSRIRLSSSDTSSNGTLPPLMPAEKYGMQNGDLITAINGNPVRYFGDLRHNLRGKENKQINVTVSRGDSLQTLALQLDSTGLLGVYPFENISIESDTFKYSFLESFKPGFKRAFGILSTNVKGFGQIARGNASAGSSVKGPVAIAKDYLDLFDSGGWYNFWLLTASLSMILAFVNILPIPALDGGHVVFLLIEGITRREPSPRVRIIAQQVGFVLIIGLMLLVISNDFIKNIFVSCP